MLGDPEGEVSTNNWVMENHQLGPVFKVILWPWTAHYITNHSTWWSTQIRMIFLHFALSKGANDSLNQEILRVEEQIHEQFTLPNQKKIKIHITKSYQINDSQWFPAIFWVIFPPAFSPWISGVMAIGASRLGHCASACRPRPGIPESRQWATAGDGEPLHTSLTVGYFHVVTVRRAQYLGSWSSIRSVESVVEIGSVVVTKCLGRSVCFQFLGWCFWAESVCCGSDVMTCHQPTDWRLIAAHVQTAIFLDHSLCVFALVNWACECCFGPLLREPLLGDHCRSAIKFSFQLHGFEWPHGHCWCRIEWHFQAVKVTVCHVKLSLAQWSFMPWARLWLHGYLPVDASGDFIFQVPVGHGCSWLYCPLLVGRVVIDIDRCYFDL